ncbi:HAD family hydrolase [Rudanella paleaurantiibacter]|uniref:HAD family hydrolase n=1 Tax=Rudanella paleaurantiibacter TaxID=2614655 RepID=UPI001FE870BB|nr:HAD family hydrolase [Rudanella paleaurantiibacter]
MLDGVEEVLDALTPQYSLMLLTKGDLLDQESKLARSGIGAYFSHVEIVSEKNEAAYQKILDRYGLQPAEFLMIGNSLKSDILPVAALGAQAIYIPYHTTWHIEQVTPPDTDIQYLQLDSLRDCLPLLLSE